MIFFKKVINQSTQSLSHVRIFATPWTRACQTSLSITNSTQTHVHWVGDAIQPSHPLSSPSPPALNLSQHQGLFKWVSSSHQVAKILEFQLQHQSFQWYANIIFLWTVDLSSNLLWHKGFSPFFCKNLLSLLKYILCAKNNFDKSSLSNWPKQTKMLFLSKSIKLIYSF